VCLPDPLRVGSGLTDALLEEPQGCRSAALEGIVYRPESDHGHGRRGNFVLLEA
jgi:hypothetical protein